MSAGTVDGRHTFDAVPASARAARAFVGDELRLAGAADAVIRDLQLVVGELATNVITHGGGSAMVVHVHLGDSQWWDVEVVGGSASPTSRLLRPDTWTIAGAWRADGRGLGIVRRLSDDVAAEMIDGHLSVRCRLHR